MLETGDLITTSRLYKFISHSGANCWLTLLIQYFHNCVIVFLSILPLLARALTVASQEHSKSAIINNNEVGVAPRAGFPLPYIMTALPDSILPVTDDENDAEEHLPPLGPDQSNQV